MGLHHRRKEGWLDRPMGYMENRAVKCIEDDTLKEEIDVTAVILDQVLSSLF